MDQRSGQDAPAVAGTAARVTLSGVPAGAPFFLPSVLFGDGSDRRKFAFVSYVIFGYQSVPFETAGVTKMTRPVTFVSQASRFWPPTVAGPVPRERVAREIYWKESLAGRRIPEGCGAGRGFAASPHPDGRQPRHRGACRPGHGNPRQERGRC
ncbi:hypothetical protein ARTHRO9AX_30096 [Arthrobacter sp. 9AX]|nr:hypothetical protein ARTHRO9AX_30096 [Arthrobacter sp. 9AX]